MIYKYEGLNKENNYGNYTWKVPYYGILRMWHIFNTLLVLHREDVFLNENLTKYENTYFIYALFVHIYIYKHVFFFYLSMHFFRFYKDVENK